MGKQKGLEKAQLWEKAGVSAETIAQFRSDTGLTQLELALLLHASVFTVSKWEIGMHCPRGYHLAQLKKLMKRFEGGEDIADTLREKLLMV